MKYIIFDKAGKIYGDGRCQKQCFPKQKTCMQPGRFIVQGVANRETQKIVFDSLDEENQPTNPRIVNLSKEEIERIQVEELEALPKPPMECDRPANITNKELQSILDRLTKLEKQ